ncbi:TMV resistance protein N-like isoform X4 [Apium graveolens]|uniref:TMV resistance protein N-like isoform X4 n=1 Tax=Apium graveolens TaxID=4045 RepID=UPI003D7BFDEA
MDTSKQVVFVWALPLLPILAIIFLIVFASRKKHLHSSEDITSNVLPTDPSSCSSSSSSAPPKWDVFLSFYGKDTRNGFTSHLYSALDQQGILTFRDDPALDKGQEISSGLLEAIKHSKIFIIVLSENYARSTWCLNELVQILKCKTTEFQVIPVFFYVDPTDVRYQKGSFREALDGHKRRHSVAMIEKWKSALSEIAALSGHHLRKEANKNESDTIQDIVRNVATRAYTTVSHQEKYLFGIDSAVEQIYQKLSMDHNDVRVIGICGMGGIGKTTIAKAFYNKYSHIFDVSCFNENVRHYSQGGSSLLPLLKQLLIDLLAKKDCKVFDVESRISKLKQILYSKKALVILDDLDQSNYSELLASLGDLFSAGSRVIITTRDTNLLSKIEADTSKVDMYMVKTLGTIDSLKLFSYHAFRRPVPPENFKELSLSFVTYAEGLPLALKILGSSLLGRTCEFWKAKLEKVKEIPEKDIHEILRLSYDELEDETEKTIFLDIAFFFVGKDKDEAVQIFKSCDFHPDVGIPVLVDRCLMTIDRYNNFQMHNLIQDMGRKLGRQTRLILGGNVWDDFQNLEDKSDIEGLILDFRTSGYGQATAEKMPKLRLFQIIGEPDIEGNFKNLFPNLRCITWHSCPWTYIPSTFCPPKLVSFDMPSSKFKILWKGPTPIKQMNYLTYLNMSKCFDLKRLPDSLGDMKALKKIDARWTAIEKLPDSITQLKGLITLDLNGCEKLRKLPQDIGNMQSLEDFWAGESAIEQLPDSITQLKGLIKLNLYRCQKLRKLPEDIGNMEGLEFFGAANSAIEQLPDSFGGLVNLVVLYLSDCKKLRNLPNSICKLKLLKQLYLSSCSNLEQLPEQLGKMQCLEYLSASDTAIEQLPDSIGLLGRLKSLYFEDCKKLKFVPESIWNLTTVEDLSLNQGETDEISSPDSVKDMNKLWNLKLSCNVRLCLPMILCFSSLTRLTLTDEGPNLSSAKPFSLSKLINLEDLTLNNCTSLGSSLPELPLNLEELNIYNHTSLEQLPDLSSSGKLRHLNIKRCIDLQSISFLPSHLGSLSVEECPSLQDVPDLSMLKELEYLSFRGCNKLKSRSLEQSFLQGKRPFKADLPNTEVAEWFNYKSSGHTVSFLVPPSFESNFLGLALWVVYTCKACSTENWWDSPYMTAVIRNETEGITEKYLFDVQPVVGEAQSTVKCITGGNLSVKSGERIKDERRDASRGHDSIPRLLQSEV